MPMSRAEAARIGGLAAASKRTQQQRKDISQRARLAAAVNTVVGRAPDLTPDQITRLRAVFAPALNEGGRAL